MLTALVLLAATANPEYEVFVFMATGCPMAKLSVGRLRDLASRYPQVRFHGISVNDQDSIEDVVRFGRELGFSFRPNVDEIDRLGATRSPEVFLLVNGRVVYQGRIDDQYTPGTNRSKPTRCDLEEAIKETLAGKRVSVPKTVADGCHISVARCKHGSITFEHVAPILHKRCADCHRPGEVAPFSLLTYEDAVGWKEMIREVVSTNRMPPWHADPKHGKFANDRSLSESEKDLLLGWIDAGAPPGKSRPAVPAFKEGWTIEPNLVMTVQSAFSVPAEGVLDYQEFVLDPGFTEDTWVQAVEIRPGNKAVVHHILAFLRPKNLANGYYVNDMRDGYLSSMVPGRTAITWPAGTAKLIPAGFQVVLSVHYQPNGTPQQDRSTIAFQFADPSSVRQKIATRIFVKEDLLIPPNSTTSESQTWTLEEDYTLHALFPHMHLRGRSMRFEIVDGPILLNVPKFDFNWQHRYVLAEPMKLRAGTVVRWVAEFDNTPSNPNNPDPNATVKHGLQSTDEMFQGCFEVARTNENRLAPRIRLLPVLAALVIAFIGLRFLGRS
jgi:hypothetical protein